MVQMERLTVVLSGMYVCMYVFIYAYNDVWMCLHNVLCVLLNRSTDGIFLNHRILLSVQEMRSDYKDKQTNKHLSWLPHDKVLKRIVKLAYGLQVFSIKKTNIPDFYKEKWFIDIYSRKNKLHNQFLHGSDFLSKSEKVNSFQQKFMISRKDFENKYMEIFTS